MPSDSDRLAQKGSRGWLRVLVGVVFAFPAAFFAWRAAFAYVFAPLAPAAVLAVFPGYPDAVEVEIERGLVRPDQTLNAPNAGQAAKLRAALQRQPLSSRGLRLLAMERDVEGESPGALAFLKVSNAISRRDVVTEVYLGKEALQRQDAVGAMRYFDAALATNSGAQQLLFPVMVRALTVPELRREMARYVDHEWAGSFLKFAVTQADPAIVEELARSRPAAQTDDDFAEFRSVLVARYAAAGELDKATRYARLVAGKGKGGAIGAFGLSEATTDQTFAPVTWRLANTPEVVADMDATGVFATISPGSRGTVMDREVALRPGGYVFTTRYSAVALPTEFTTEWQVDCLRGTGRSKIATLDLPYSSGVATRAVRIAMPAGCRAAAFTLTASNFDDQTSAELNVLALSLEAAR